LSASKSILPPKYASGIPLVYIRAASPVLISGFFEIVFQSCRQALRRTVICLLKVKGIGCPTDFFPSGNIMAKQS